jgi:hypothetical protein
MWLYRNGNYLVCITKGGSKYRIGKNPNPLFPESIDIKITNKCDAACPYCHESSQPNGKHGNWGTIKRFLYPLPAGIELAIGGGNPLEFPHLEELVTGLRLHNRIANLTVNAQHLEQMKDSGIRPNALGISYVESLHEDIVLFCRMVPFQTVIHLIAGVHTIDDLEKCLFDFDRILILGYKGIGRGTDHFSQATADNLSDMQRNIGLYIGKSKVLAFDNAAIKQLDIPRFFTKKTWEKFYMGDDGEYTMYIDFVEQEYGISSTSQERFPLDSSIQECFSQLRSKEENKK